MQVILSELCAAWPNRGDKYASWARRVKRRLPYTSLPGTLSHFEFLFGLKPRVYLDTLVPHVDDTELRTSLDAAIKNHWETSREVT